MHTCITTAPAILRETSRQTSYQVVRWVFRPYAQLRRTICTSVLRPASTTLSHGFAVAGYSSPPFGSRHHVLALRTMSNKTRVRCLLQAVERAPLRRAPLSHIGRGKTQVGPAGLGRRHAQRTSFHKTRQRSRCKIAFTTQSVPKHNPSTTPMGRERAHHNITDRKSVV